MSKVGPIAAAASEVVSSAYGLSEAMAPEKGFAYNLCAFQIDLRDEQQEEPQVPAKPASLATAPSGAGSTFPTANGQSTSAAATERGANPAAVQARPGPVIFEVREGTPGQAPHGGSTLEVGIRELTTQDRIIGVVELRKLENFDAGAFDSLNLEVAVQEHRGVPRGVMLIIKGFVDPADALGSVVRLGNVGYAHFVGAVLLLAQPATTGRASLVCKPQFITQTPPRGTGVGILGKVIESYAQGDRLRIRMYRAPMGSD